MFAVSALGIQNVTAQNNNDFKQEVTKKKTKKQPNADVATPKRIKTTSGDVMKSNDQSDKHAVSNGTTGANEKDVQHPNVSNDKKATTNRATEPKVKTAANSQNNGNGNVQVEKKKKNQKPETRKPKMKKESTMKKADNASSANTNANASQDKAARPKPKIKKEASTNNKTGDNTK